MSGYGGRTAPAPPPPVKSFRTSSSPWLESAALAEPLPKIAVKKGGLPADSPSRQPSDGQGSASTSAAAPPWSHLREGLPTTPTRELREYSLYTAPTSPATSTKSPRTTNAKDVSPFPLGPRPASSTRPAGSPTSRYTQQGTSSPTFPSSPKVKERASTKRDEGIPQDLSSRRWITEEKKREWRSGSLDNVIDISQLNRSQQAGAPFPAADPAPVFAPDLTTRLEPSPLPLIPINTSPSSSRSASPSVIQRARPTLDSSASSSSIPSTSSTATPWRPVAASSQPTRYLDRIPAPPEPTDTTHEPRPTERAASIASTHSVMDRPRQRTPERGSDRFATRRVFSDPSSCPPVPELGSSSAYLSSSISGSSSSSRINLGSSSTAASSTRSGERNPASSLKLDLALESDKDDLLFDVASYFSTPSVTTERKAPILPDTVGQKTDMAVGLGADKKPTRAAPPPPLVLSKPIKLNLQAEQAVYDDMLDGEQTPLASDFANPLELSSPTLAPVYLSTATAEAIDSMPSTPISYVTPTRLESLSASSTLASLPSTYNYDIGPDDDSHAPLPLSHIVGPGPSLPALSGRPSLNSLASADSTTDSATSLDSVSVSSLTSTKQKRVGLHKRDGSALAALILVERGHIVEETEQDKSLPPTPTFKPLPTEYVPDVTAAFPLPPGVASPPQTSLMTAMSFASQPAPPTSDVPLLRQLSRLRPMVASAEVSSLDSKARPAMLDALLTSVPAPPSPSGSASPSTTRQKLRKRLAERFSPSSSKSTQSAPVTPVTQRPDPFLRSDSSSSLSNSVHSITRDSDSKSLAESIGAGTRAAGSKGKKLAGSLLGMGLLSARKSEDALGMSSSTRQPRSNEEGLSPVPPPAKGRKSFDIFTRGKPMPTQPGSASNTSLGSAISALSKVALAKRSIPTPDELAAQKATENRTPSSEHHTSTSGSSDSSLPLPRPPARSTSSSRSSTEPSPTEIGSTPYAEKKSRGPSEASGKRSVSLAKASSSGTSVEDANAVSWEDLEDTLMLYLKVAPSVGHAGDRGAILTTIVLPFMKREDQRVDKALDVVLVKSRRAILFSWLANLTFELRNTQPVHRGACLESVAAIAENHLMSATLLEQDREDEIRYRSAIVQLLAFSIDKLNDKAVYANTLVLSGRILALAFFRIEGVALKLLKSLPAVKRSFLRRILAEVGIDERNLPLAKLDAFPAHLQALCLTNFAQYTALLAPLQQSHQPESDRFLVQDEDCEVEMSGNWLIRWTASDSDLPFAFYRSYHRQLAAYLIPTGQHTSGDLLSPASIITAPAFLFLAGSLLEKCDALVHQNLRSVTSIGPNSGANFDTNDSANLEVGRKPKVLELATRRLVSTLLDVVGGPPLVTPADFAGSPPDATIRRNAFSRMLQVWIRATVKKTSMYDTRSVFILMDLLEGLIYTLSYPVIMERTPILAPDEACLVMFDIPFIFSFVKTILTTADNTVAVTRTIAFIYAHFELLTLRASDRQELCETIILDETIFLRLYLSWNGAIRSYFIRLLVWRVARLGIVEEEYRPKSLKAPDIVRVFGLLNVRLEVIRRRHDELEPAVTESAAEDDLYRPKRSTICSTKGVSEAPYVDDNVQSPTRVKTLDSVELVSPVDFSGPEDANGSVRDGAGVSRVVSWLKGGLGKAGRIAPKALGTNARHQNGRIVSLVAEEAGAEDGLGVSTVGGEEDIYSGSETKYMSLGALPSPLSSVSSSLSSGQRSASSLNDLAGRPASPGFFAFEFEPSSPLPPIPVGTASSPLPDIPVISQPLEPASPPMTSSSKNSKRFSKRASILPPAALGVLQNIGEAVPLIPEKYRGTSGYEKRLHPYAIRGLRDYEDALDEWTEWVARLSADETVETQAGGFIDEVPRLAVPWPLSLFEE